MNTRENDEEWLLGMRKYFRVHNYSSKIKACLDIYKLNGKVAKWWRDLKHTKKYELIEIRWSKFHKIIKEKYELNGDSMKMGNTFWPNLAMKT